jgi:hypothetical protein
VREPETYTVRYQVISGDVVEIGIHATVNVQHADGLWHVWEDGKVAPDDAHGDDLDHDKAIYEWLGSRIGARP